MKVSIIIPVYNGESTIEQCLDALVNQDYTKNDFEIIVVDGCSTDRTPEIVGKVLKKSKNLGIIFKYIRSQEREGRLLARIKGGEEANYNLLLFIDSRLIVDRNILKNIEKIDYNPMVGNPLMKVDTPLSRFFWLIRKKYYPHSGEKFKPVYIEEENFDKIGKGTTLFLCNKDLFLSSQLVDKGEHVSDDIKLLWNIVQKRKILEHPDFKGTYLSRSSLKEEIIHTFWRGPKFVDYYLDLRKRNFWIFIFLPLFSLFLTISLFLINFIYFLYWLTLLFFFLLSTSIWLSENINDFFIIIILLPIIFITFELGILKGLEIKFLRAHNFQEEATL